MRTVLAIGLALEFLVTAGGFGQVNAQPRKEPPNHVEDSVASNLNNKAPIAGNKYAGDEICSTCHREKVQTFHQTAHFLTSRMPDDHSVMGKFGAGENIVRTSNPELFFRMVKRDDGYFQTAVEGTAPYVSERTERFGLVIGSGGKGETYLYWKGNQLFQLPISYWTQLGWVNSPGFRDGVANFDRPIIPRCLECHATYFESTPPPANRYDETGFIAGITCEKCHGPGREHIRIESSPGKTHSESAIVNPAKLSRDREMDLCAWCHAGQGAPLAPSFAYVPGEALSEYLEIADPSPAAAVDVHGGQIELLKRSRCFQSSSMTCLTCHDVHSVQHDLSAFSERCLGCHKPETATFPKLGHQPRGNCIECHMPMQETNLIVFDANGKKAKPKVRSHWIKTYPGTNP